MKRVRKSVFDLERRIDLEEEYDELLDVLNSTWVKAHGSKSYTIMELLNEAISDWQYREGASGIVSYLNKRGINVDAENETPFSTEERVIFTMELFFNLLRWAPEHDKRLENPLNLRLDAIPLESSLNPYIENIQYILERCNMSVRERIVKAGFPQYIITKRDANVDAVIEEVPELSESLLSYLDIRNQNDEMVKKTILLQIADYLEPRRKIYRGTAYAGLTEDLFTVFNKCNVRHNDKDQIKLRKDKRIALYDKTFKVAIHVLQLETVNKFKENIRELKEKETQQKMDVRKKRALP